MDALHFMKQTDMFNDFSKSHLPSESGQISEFFGTNPIVQQWAREGRPMTSITLAAAYAGDNTYLTTIIHQAIEDVDGWWFRICPRKLARTMNTQWDMLIADRSSLEPTPEGVAPRLVSTRTETGYYTLERFGLGAKAYGDFWDTEQGKKIATMNLQQISSGKIVSQKIMVTNAVLGCKLKWKQWDMQYGSDYYTVNEALMEETRLFGVLSRSEKAIYALNDYVSDIGRRANVKYDTIVLSKGALSTLIYNKPYETEKFRRGDSAETEKKLTQGSTVFKYVFEGIEIFEDNVYALQNIQDKEVNLFVRTATIGAFSMIDGSDFGSRSGDDYKADEALQVSIMSLDTDNWKKFDYVKAIRSNLVFNEKGEICEEMRNLAMNADVIVQKSGVKLASRELLDPHIWMDDFGRYHVIEYWGDSYPRYLTNEQIRSHGERASKRICDKLLEEDKIKIDKVKSLSKRLYDVTNLMGPSTQGYFFAIAGNPENRTPGTDDPTEEAGNILKANRFGAPMLPHVEKTPKAHARMGGNEVNLPNGALYVMGPNRTRHYVWALYSEDFTGKTRIRGIQADGSQTGTEYNLTGVTINYTNQPGTLSQFVLAPLDAFGPVDPTGTAHGFNAHVGTQLQSMAFKLHSGLIDNKAGYEPPRLVEAPAIPFGYGEQNGLRTLSQMYSEGNFRGWPKEELKIAFDGITSLDKLGRTLKDFYPESAFWDTQYLPYYMKSGTGDEITNQKSSVFASLLNGVHHPVWTRIPLFSQLTTTFSGLEVVTNIDAIRLLPDAGGKNDPDDQTSLSAVDAMGFASVGVALVHARANLAGFLRDLMAEDNFDGSIVQDFTSDSGRKMFGLYNENIGPNFVKFAVSSQLVEANRTSAFFVSLLDLLLTLTNGVTTPPEKRLQRSQAASIFNVFYGLSRTNKKLKEEEIKEAFIRARTMINQSSSKRKKNESSTTEVNLHNIRSTRITTTATTIGGVRTNDSAEKYFINTRLCISPSPFKSMDDMLATNDPLNIFHVKSCILRPSDPANDSKPLSASFGAFTTLRDMEYARASMPRTDSFVPLTSEEEIQISSDSLLDAYTTDTTYLPLPLTGDAVGPLTSLGVNSLGHSEAIAKKYLVSRFKTFSEIDDDFVRIPCMMLCLTKATRTSLENFVAKNLPPPDAVQIIARPFIQVRTSCGIWAASGADTGEIAEFSANTSIQYNGMSKTWFMNYTVFLGAAVLNVYRIHIQSDVKFEGYVRGMDDTIINIEDWDTTNFTTDRLGSCMVWSCGSNFSRDEARKRGPISLFGTYDKKFVPNNYAGQSSDDTVGMWPSFHFANYLWNFAAINQSSTGVDCDSYQALKESNHMSGILVIENHLVYDPITRKHCIYKGNSHLDGIIGSYRTVLSGKVVFPEQKEF